MKLYNIFYLFTFILFIYSFCNSCKGKNEKQSIVKSIKIEPIDSIYVENFLLKNTEFKSQRKKILKFYSRRNYSLAWFEKETILPQASMFINVVNNIENEGLPQVKFDYKKLKALYSNVILEKKQGQGKEEEKKTLDLLLTASYFAYAKNIWRGTIDPKEEEIEWYVQRKKIKYGKTLDAILEDKTHPFSSFEPLNPEYSKLKNALAALKQLEKKGGWPKLNFEGKLKTGDTSQTVILIKNILSVMGDLKSNNSSNVFDITLEEGIKKFQSRHGLESDGIIAGRTIKELAVPVSSRTQQIIVNMERWRWVPQESSSNYLVVNIPEFKLKVFEKGKEIWNMNVIVGKAANSTPIFNDILEFIVFSPYWNVPKSIVVNELIPLIRKNPVVLEKEDMEVYEGKPENVIDPSTVDWNAVDEETTKYQFRQRPGPTNSLGKVKFLFPNEYDVYLHDTPGHALFSQAQRGFSHGCIRLEQPQKLAEYLLKDEPEWDKQKIEEAMNSGVESFVKLKTKVPVYILYFTSWVDEKGILNFRNDIYSHDERLAKSFFESK